MYPVLTWVTLFSFYFISRYRSGYFFFTKIMLPMLKLDTNSGFHELFLNQLLPCIDFIFHNTYVNLELKVCIQTYYNVVVFVNYSAKYIWKVLCQLRRDVEGWYWQFDFCLKIMHAIQDSSILYINAAHQNKMRWLVIYLHFEDTFMTTLFH